MFRHEYFKLDRNCEQIKFDASLECELFLNAQLTEASYLHPGLLGRQLHPGGNSVPRCTLVNHTHDSFERKSLKKRVRVSQKLSNFYLVSHALMKPKPLPNYFHPRERFVQSNLLWNLLRYTGSVLYGDTNILDERDIRFMVDSGNSFLQSDVCTVFSKWLKSGFRSTPRLFWWIDSYYQYVLFQINY